MRALNSQTNRIFFFAAFAFCGAAVVTGVCFVFAIQTGLERLALYHPLAEKQAVLQSLHPVRLSPVTVLQADSFYMATPCVKVTAMACEKCSVLMLLCLSGCFGVQLTRASLTRFELSSDDTLLVSKPAKSLRNSKVRMMRDLPM